MNFVSAFFRVLFFSFLFSFAVIFFTQFASKCKCIAYYTPENLHKKEVFWQNGPFQLFHLTLTHEIAFVYPKSHNSYTVC